jgi:hypothetical protein
MAEVLFYLTGVTWSEAELAAASSHEAAIRELLDQSQIFVDILSTPLDIEHRALVEASTWFEFAVAMFRDRLAVNIDDFVTAALEVYTSSP